VSTYIKTISFKSIVLPDPGADDPVVNHVVDAIRAAGGTIRSIDLAIGGGLSWISTYVIKYEAEAPLELPTPKTAGSGWFVWLMVVMLGVLAFGLVALALLSTA
jgi:hypothetical protein